VPKSVDSSAVEAGGTSPGSTSRAESLRGSPLDMTIGTQPRLAVCGHSRYSLLGRSASHVGVVAGVGCLSIILESARASVARLPLEAHFPTPSLTHRLRPLRNLLRATLGPHDSRERPLGAFVNHLRNVPLTCGSVEIRRLPRAVFRAPEAGSVGSNPTGGSRQTRVDLRKRVPTCSARHREVGRGEPRVLACHWPEHVMDSPGRQNGRPPRRRSRLGSRPVPAPRPR
jgi:hypothetical protein